VIPSKHYCTWIHVPANVRILRPEPSSNRLIHSSCSCSILPPSFDSDMETAAITQDIFRNVPSGPQTIFEHMEQTIQDESDFVAKEVCRSPVWHAQRLVLTRDVPRSLDAVGTRITLGRTRQPKDGYHQRDARDAAGDARPIEAEPHQSLLGIMRAPQPINCSFLPVHLRERERQNVLQSALY